MVPELAFTCMQQLDGFLIADRTTSVDYKMGVEWSNICTVQSKYALVCTYWTLACPGLAVS